ncbi:hypothetical protein [Brevundimonas sp.]|uniref:hypothetical protein n=1 Tax=Brevundimonas sp. TaxID=1871086 RepID=UPI002D331D51|nr:hypothetical protein [Brevundimonas sp.]HYC66878.1 hypothetical protein [Brevundimonas sp.]
MATVPWLDPSAAANHVRAALSIQRTVIARARSPVSFAPSSARRASLSPTFRETPMQAHAIAAAGVTAASARFEASARRTAADPLADLAGETVERIGAEIALKANASVLLTADAMTGTLLDMLA